MAKVTIEDISRHTGLSRGTVSRALNDRPDISQQTKQRVLEACRKLNFSPSHAARSLATGRSFAVAVLLDDLHSVFAASLLRGVLRQAQAALYSVHVAELTEDPERQRQAIAGLERERIDSVLLGAPLADRAAPALREALEDRPLVGCARIDGFACDLLIPDQVEAGRLVARHLLRGGERRILYVHAALPGAGDRLAGFQEVCREHGLDAERLTVRVPTEQPINNDETTELLGRRIREVRAIAATDDALAIDVMKLCCQMGRMPGRDVAIVGQGNERLSARICPPLTTIDFCGEEIGRRAMEIVLQRLGKERMDAPQTTQVAPLLLARASTRMLA